MTTYNCSTADMQRASHSLLFNLLHRTKPPVLYRLPTKTTAPSVRCYTQILAYRLLRKPLTTRTIVSARIRLSLPLVSLSNPVSNYRRCYCSDRRLVTMAPTDRDILPETCAPAEKPIKIETKTAAALNLFIMIFPSTILSLGVLSRFKGYVLSGLNILSGFVLVGLDLDRRLLVRSNVTVRMLNQLKVNSAGISGNGIKSQKASEILYIEKSQRVSLEFKDEIPDGEGAVLELQYSGVMNNDMAGFYRSRYKPETTPAASVPKVGEFHFMFSTQFESCDARRAFPCFDEPNLKASFDVSIEIPEDQVALSNMPEKAVKETKHGRKVVSFERTPVMSTYLLAWAFGDFEYVEDFTKRKYKGKPLPVRVYTIRGLKEQGRFALHNAHQVVDYFSEIFGIDYPLPKADLLAVHEFSHGAMENWGLVTYRTTAVLYDEKHSDAKYKVRGTSF